MKTLHKTLLFLILFAFSIICTSQTGYAQDAIKFNIIGKYKPDKADAKAGKWEEFSGTIHITNETIVFYLKSNITLYITEIHRESKYDWDFKVSQPDIGQAAVNLWYEEEESTWFIAIFYEYFSIMYACDQIETK